MVQHPPGRTSVCPVDKDLVRIGRHPTNDIVIDDIYVSGYHAELHRLPGGTYELVDLSSFNGTFVNCQRIQQRVALQDGDVLAFALTQAKFRLHVTKEAEAAGHAWSAAVRERTSSEKNGKTPFPLPQAQPAPLPLPLPHPQPPPALHPQLPAQPQLSPQPHPYLPPESQPYPQAQPAPAPAVLPHGSPLAPRPLQPPSPAPFPSQNLPLQPAGDPGQGPKTLPLRPPARLTPPAPTAPRPNGASGLGCGVVLRFEPDTPASHP